MPFPATVSGMLVRVVFFDRVVNCIIPCEWPEFLRHIVCEHDKSVAK